MELGREENKNFEWMTLAGFAELKGITIQALEYLLVEKTRTSGEVLESKIDYVRVSEHRRMIVINERAEQYTRRKRTNGGD